LAFFGPVSGPRTAAEEVALKLGKHSEHAGERPPTWRRQIERLGHRDEGDAERRELVERRDEVRDGPPPTIKPPDEDRVEFTTPRAGD
jgi:hypothetical protein